MKKKLLAILLALGLVITCMPMAAFAATAIEENQLSFTKREGAADGKYILTFTVPKAIYSQTIWSYQFEFEFDKNAFEICGRYDDEEREDVVDLTHNFTSKLTPTITGIKEVNNSGIVGISGGSGSDIAFSKDISITMKFNKKAEADLDKASAFVINGYKIWSTDLDKPIACLTSDEKAGTAAYTLDAGRFTVAANSAEGTAEHTHTYGTPTYEWNYEDPKNVTCTATKTCTDANCSGEGKTVTETVTMQDGKISLNASSKPSCTEAGEEVYTATFADGSKTKGTRVLPALGHKYDGPTYKWNYADPENVTCTATKKCRSCEEEATKTVNAVVEETTEATCTTPAKTIYKAEFEEEFGGVQTETVESGSATGHTPKEMPEKAATCTEAGNKACWHCEACKKYFADEACQNEMAEDDVIIPAGHTYGNVEYKWSNDYTTCTASRKCKTDPSHIETEEATVTSEVTQEATCTQAEVTTYTATFENKALFEKQTKVVTGEIDPNNHDYEVTYAWDLTNQSGVTCTATGVCTRNGEHKKIEEAKEITENIIEEATCTSKGKKKYTAIFDSFDPSESDEVGIPATSHKYDGTWEHNETQHWKVCETCKAKAEVANHTYGSGENTNKCTVCEYEKTYTVTCNVTRQGVSNDVEITGYLCKKDSTYNDTITDDQFRNKESVLTAFVIKEASAVDNKIIFNGVTAGNYVLVILGDETTRSTRFSFNVDANDIFQQKVLYLFGDVNGDGDLTEEDVEKFMDVVVGNSICDDTIQAALGYRVQGRPKAVDITNARRIMGV